MVTILALGFGVGLQRLVSDASALLRSLSRPCPDADRDRGSPRRRRISRSICSIASASLVAVVIVADEMQETVHRKMGDMMSKRLAFGSGLPRDGLVGKDDVAEMRRLVRGLLARERQHVGGGVDAAPMPVELADRRIIGQDDSKLRPALLTAWRPPVRRRAARSIWPWRAPSSRSESTSTSILSFARGAGVIPAARACAPRLCHRPRRCAPPVRGGSRRRP